MGYLILTVRDMNTSVAFYRDVLGFNMTFALPGPDGCAFAEVLRNDTRIGLSAVPGCEDSGKPGSGVEVVIHLKQSDEVAALYQRLKSLDGVIARDLKRGLWGTQTFSIHDPDGYYLTFGQQGAQQVHASLKTH